MSDRQREFYHKNATSLVTPSLRLMSVCTRHFSSWSNLPCDNVEAIPFRCTRVGTIISGFLNRRASTASQRPAVGGAPGLLKLFSKSVYVCSVFSDFWQKSNHKIDLRDSNIQNQEDIKVNIYTYLIQQRICLSILAYFNLHKPCQIESQITYLIMFMV